MKVEPDNREIKCYLCDKKLFAIRHAYSKFVAFCPKCLASLEKQEADQVKWLGEARQKMKESNSFYHPADL
jgi:hypothetical protein